MFMGMNARQIITHIIACCHVVFLSFRIPLLPNDVEYVPAMHHDEAILAAMRAHPSNFDAQADGCISLGAIIDDEGLYESPPEISKPVINSERRRSLVAAGGIPIAVDALARFGLQCVTACAVFMNFLRLLACGIDDDDDDDAALDEQAQRYAIPEGSLMAITRATMHWDKHIFPSDQQQERSDYQARIRKERSDYQREKLDEIKRHGNRLMSKLMMKPNKK